MTANLDWGVPHLLTTPKGTLPFNTALGSAGDGILLLDQEKCSCAPAPRVFTDDVPQDDGTIIHKKFKTGYVVRLGFQLWTAAAVDGGERACGELQRELWDYIMLRLNALFQPDEADLDIGNCRLQWTPEGYGDDRMFNPVELFEWPAPTYAATGLDFIAFGLHSPLPYAIDLTQRTTTIESGATETLTNPGSSRYKPVFKVHGPVSAFTIINETTGQQIGYDGGLPPGVGGISGGDYAEIATFNNTAFLNGDSSNLNAYIDANTSEFFALEPGPNEILFSGDGGTCEVLWNPAWA